MLFTTNILFFVLMYEFEKREFPMTKEEYWDTNIKLIIKTLVIWFVVSYLFGIILVDVLNTIQLGGYKLGFWFAQQGAIYVFVGLIFWYSAQINKLDDEYNKTVED